MAERDITKNEGRMPTCSNIKLVNAEGLGQFLKTILEEKKLSHLGVCRACQMSTRTVYNLLHAHLPTLRISVLNKLARGLGVAIEKFCDAAGIPDVEKKRIVMITQSTDWRNPAEAREQVVIEVLLNGLSEHTRTLFKIVLRAKKDGDRELLEGLEDKIALLLSQLSQSNLAAKIIRMLAK